MPLKPSLAVWSQDQFVEQLRIEKARIRLPGLGTITNVTRKTRDSDFFLDFKTHLKVLGNLIEVMPGADWQLVGDRRWNRSRRCERAVRRCSGIDNILPDIPSQTSSWRTVADKLALASLRRPTLQCRNELRERGMRGAIVLEEDLRN